MVKNQGKYKRSGWFFESNRHSLASKGISSGKKSYNPNNLIGMNDYMKSGKSKLQFPVCNSCGHRHYRKAGKKCEFVLKHGNEPDNKFNKRQLAMGINVETEHTNDRSIAKQIAKAHLNEDKLYYTKLKSAKL